MSEVTKKSDTSSSQMRLLGGDTSYMPNLQLKNLDQSEALKLKKLKLKLFYNNIIPSKKKN